MTASTPSRHLSEDERQGAADGALTAEQSRAVAEHVARCDDCATDVARLKTLMTRIQASPPPAALDEPDLWPNIRSRIEQSKVVRLDAAQSESPRAAPIFGRRSVWIPAAVAATLLIAASALLWNKTSPGTPIPVASNDSSSLISVADSARSYEAEANTLLNELEMQRSMMRPQTAATVDRDLRTIDQAIAELKEAVAHDPNNPALRRLLASSYRQKVELLKRAHNPG